MQFYFHKFLLLLLKMCLRNNMLVNVETYNFVDEVNWSVTAPVITLSVIQACCSHRSMITANKHQA